MYLENDLRTKNLLSENTDPNIQVIEVSTSLNLSLGAQRNLSIEKANGEYICLWDDDDWYHSQRLELQYRAIDESKKAGSILIFSIVYNEVAGTAYMSSPGPKENSIMVRKSALNGIRYDDKNVGEDTPFVYSLLNENLIYSMIDPCLYIYVFTGHNTCTKEHFDRIFQFSDPLSEEASQTVKQILNNSTSEESIGSKAEEILDSINYFHWWRPLDNFVKEQSEKESAIEPT